MKILILEREGMEPLVWDVDTPVKAVGGLLAMFRELDKDSVFSEAETIPAGIKLRNKARRGDCLAALELLETCYGMPNWSIIETSSFGGPDCMAEVMNFTHSAGWPKFQRRLQKYYDYPADEKETEE